jgi:hypothetical protein
MVSSQHFGKGALRPAAGQYCGGVKDESQEDPQFIYCSSLKNATYHGSVLETSVLHKGSRLAVPRAMAMPRFWPYANRVTSEDR